MLTDTPPTDFYRARTKHADQWLAMTAECAEVVDQQDTVLQTSLQLLASLMRLVIVCASAAMLL